MSKKKFKTKEEQPHYVQTFDKKQLKKKKKTQAQY